MSFKRGGSIFSPRRRPWALNPSCSFACAANFFANSYLAGFKEINELDSENTRKAHPAPRDTAARGRAASRRDANQFL
jgi:hypothetical protein